MTVHRHFETRIAIPVLEPRSGRPSRLPWFAVAVGSFLLFVLDLILVVNHLTTGQDRSISLDIHRVFGRSSFRFFEAISNAGSETPRVVLVAGVAVILVAMRRPWSAALLATVVGGAAALDTFTKSLVARPRPHLFAGALHAPGYAFPSGHSFETAACVGALAFLVWHVSGRRSLGLPAVLVAMTAAGLVGLSRVVLGVHYPTDVLGGWFLALAWLALMALLLSRRLRRERSNRERRILPEA